MSDDIQSKVVMDPAQALQGYDALTSKQQRLNRAVEQGNRAAKDYQKTMGKSFRDAGQAATRAGGVVGSTGGQILGSAGADSAFGRIGVAVGLAAFSFKALTAVTEHRIAVERSAIEQTQKLGAALDAAGKSGGQQGVSAIPLGQQVRSLMATGGNIDDAAKLADKLAIPIEDAVRGLTEINRKTSTTAEREGAIREASILSSAGSMSFSEAASGLTSKGSLKQMFDAGPGVAGAALLRSRGEKTTASELADFAPRVLAQSEGVGQLDQIQRDRNKIALAGLDHLKNGDAAKTVNDQLAETLNPAMVAVVKWSKGLQESIDTLRKLSREQGLLASAMANAGMLLGGQGSLEQQARRAEITRAQTLNNTPLRGGD
jgi:hypothetical protein